MARRKNSDISQDVSENIVPVEVAGTCRVRRTYTKKGQVVSEDEDAEDINVTRFVTQPAEVGITYGSTINLGNYEAARIDVWCKIPTYREEMSEAFEFVKKFADEKMKSEMDDISNGMNKKHKDHNPF